jgi:hypothetical protein
MAGVEQNVLARRLLAIPEYKAKYLESVMKAARIMGAAGGLMDELITRYYAQMSADARADPNKQCAELGVPYTCGAAEFEAGVDYIRQFAQTRGFSVTSQANALGYVPPAE